MKGLLLKDFYNLKVYMRQYVVLLVFFMAIGVSTGNAHYIMWMSLVLGLNLGFSTFPVDEAGGYAYMLSCPVGRRTCVQAKYLIHLTAAAAMLACSIIGEIINRLLDVGPTDMRSWLVEMAFVLGVYLFFTSVLIPVAYRYGVEKARVVMLGMAVIPMMAVFLSVKLIEIAAVTKLLDTITEMFTQEQMVCYVAFFFLAAGLLLFGCSYLLSVKIFERKEF